MKGPIQGLHVACIGPFQSLCGVNVGPIHGRVQGLYTGLDGSGRVTGQGTCIGPVYGLCWAYTGSVRGLWRAREGLLQGLCRAV